MSNLTTIKSYLRSNSGVGTALDIARDVLKMSNIKADMAHSLVRHMLESDPEFYESAPNQWSLKCVEPSDTWVLCKLFPANSSPMQIQQIRMATFYEDSILRSQIFNPESAEMISFIAEYPMMFDGIGNQVSNFQRLVTLGDNPVFKLSKVLKKLFPGKPVDSGSDISELLNLSHLQDADFEIQFQLYVEQVQQTWRLLRNRGIHTLEQLEKFVTPARIVPDYERYHFDQEFIHTLPAAPGVYVMKNIKQQVIYVGKAKNLAQRLQSYFRPSEQLESKLEHIRAELFDVEITTTGSELAALLLEQELIDRFQPRINQQMQVHVRYIRQKERYPRILILPAAKPSHADVFLLNPGLPLVRLLVNVKHPDDNFIKQHISQVYFKQNSKASAEHKYEEIVWSWLSQSNVLPQSMDMRLFTSASETLRVLKDHLGSLGQEPVVHY